MNCRTEIKNLTTLDCNQSRSGYPVAGLLQGCSQTIHIISSGAPKDKDVN